MTTGTQIIAVDPENRYEVAQTDKVAPFIPAGFHSVIRFAELVALSGLAPKGMEKADQIAGAIFYGLEIGMTPMAAIQSIAVINGRPCIWGDGALALVRGSGLLDDIEETYEGEFSLDGKPNPNFKAVCKITRKGSKRPVVQEFTIADAQMAGLWTKANTPWITYPKRMLKMRARSWAMRDEFTDVLRGLVFAEEAQDYDDLRDIMPKNDQPPAPKDTAGTVEEVVKRKPGRPAKNKFQDDKTETVMEAEVISSTQAGENKVASPEARTIVATDDRIDDEPPAPAEAKPVEQQRQSEATAAKPKTKGETERAEHREFMKALLEEAGPNKDLKSHLEGMDALLGMTNSYEAMKVAWNNRVVFKGIKSETDIINKLRDRHKARVSKADEDKAAADTPPAPKQETVEEASAFQYNEFIQTLDEELAAQENADDITTVFGQITEEPLKLGLVTAEQDEKDLRPILAAHLDRVAELS